MIHYVEGIPGMGKTYFSVVILAPRLIKSRIKKYEHVFSNVRGFKSEQFDVDSMDQKNSLFIIDELQAFNKHHDKLFLHLCEHRHLGQDWIIMTQVKDAIPRKFLGLIEKSYSLEPVAGSASTRAVCRLGKPLLSNKAIISNEIFKPRDNDVYDSVSAGAEMPKRKMPFKYILIFAALPMVIFVAAKVTFWSYDKFASKGTTEVSVPSPDPLPVFSSKDRLKPTRKVYNEPVADDSCPDSLGGSFEHQLLFLDCHSVAVKRPEILHSRVNGLDIYHSPSTSLRQFDRERSPLVFERFLFSSRKRQERFLIDAGKES